MKARFKIPSWLAAMADTGRISLGGLHLIGCFLGAALIGSSVGRLDAQSFGLEQSATVYNQPTAVGGGGSGAVVTFGVSSSLSATSGGGSFRLEQVQAGAPYFVKVSTVLFGDVITPPNVDIAGSDLGTTLNTEYWLAEPLDPSSDQYYWSPHSRVIYASQTGAISIVWVKAAADSEPTWAASAPSGDGETAEDTNGNLWYRIDGEFHQTLSQSYQVSGVPVKTPQTVFWNVAPSVGPLVEIPVGEVQDIVFVFNTTVGETVGEPILDPTTQTETALDLTSRKTIYRGDTGSEDYVFANNAEGRVFVELLGDPNPDDPTVSQPLGFEIVELIAVAPRVDATVDLGELILPEIDDQEVVDYRPYLLGVDSDFYYEHQPEGAAVSDLYAVKPTVQLNDFLIYWMIEGEAGVRWPRQLTRYHLQWPESVVDYQHYVRPNVSSAAEALSSSIPIPVVNVPQVEYSDHTAGIAEGLTEIDGETQQFYTYLGGDTLASRALIRYTAGDEVAFERIFSWREDGIAGPSVTPEGQTAVYTYNNGELAYEDGSLTSYLTQPSAVALSEDGSLAYVVTYGSDMGLVLDVSDPENVVLLSDTFSITGTSGLNSGIDVAINGTAMYLLAKGDDRLYVINVEDPSSPARELAVRRDSNDNDYMDGARYMALEGDRLYVSASIGDALVVFQIPEDDPYGLEYLDSIDHGDLDVDGESILLDGPQATHVEDGIAYIVTLAAPGRMSIVNVSDLQNPDQLAVVENGVGDVQYMGNPEFIAVADGYAYVSDGTNDSITIFDITNPNTDDPGTADVDESKTVDFNPEFVAVIRNGVDGYSLLDQPQGLHVEDGLLFVSARGTDGLTIIDVRNPHDPKLVDELSGADLGFGGAAGIAVKGHKIYLPARDGESFSIIEWGDPRWGWDAEHFVGTPVAELTEFEEVGGFFPRLRFSVEAQAPRVVYEAVSVGDRLAPPEGELGSGEDEEYLAGFVQPIFNSAGEDVGDSYSTSAYINPLDPLSGIELARTGSIIPVNAIPEQNEMRVHWFRDSSLASQGGFEPVYWPAVLGVYTIEWPSEPIELVIADRDASGPLEDFDDGAGDGKVYFENDSSLPGYNPNEEHAFVDGGIAYAIRDDLNETGTENYSSHPFVLIEYTASDGRPSMIPFKVVREKPSEGIVFSYQAVAGERLPVPGPLGVLDLPYSSDSVSTSTALISLNGERSQTRVVAGSNDQYDATTLETTFAIDLERGGLQAKSEYVILDLPDVDGSPVFGDNRYLYTLSVSDEGDVTGYLSEQPAWEAVLDEDTEGRFVIDVVSGSFPVHQDTVDETLTNIYTDVVLLSRLYDLELLVSVSDSSQSGLDGESEDSVTVDLTSVNWGSVEVSLSEFLDSVSALMILPLSANALAPDEFLGHSISGALDSQATSISGTETIYVPSSYGNYTLQDRTGVLWAYRGAHLTETSEYEVQFHYPLQKGFYFPALATQPDVGELMPFLRVPGDVEGTYRGLGNEVETPSQSIGVKYVPVWPDNPLEIRKGRTLTLASDPFPQIRGSSSVEILYDQGIANEGIESRSATLHDPTREKQYLFEEDEESGDPIEIAVGGYNFMSRDGNSAANTSAFDLLTELPEALNTVLYNGEYFFPDLPPHLSERFFFDPNRGQLGALVFRGEFVDEITGEDYLLLNVLSDEDLWALRELLPETSDDYEAWYYAIDHLETELQLFTEDEGAPGTFIGPDSEAGEAGEIKGPGDVSAIDDEDIAVDSYALSATGPYHGFVTVMLQNGRAFTQEDDVIAMYVFKVIDEWHTGEIKVIESSNPLSEKLIMRQTVDLAGEVDDFEFEWRIASPTDENLAPTIDQDAIDTLTWRLMSDSDGIRATIGGAGDVNSLGDQYVTVRYGRKDDATGVVEEYSEWTAAQLAEGWIKRVLAGINPFNQRTSDLFNNAVDTDASMLTLAGPRWEGDVALNEDTVNEAGLIEIYETVLNRGKALSIDAEHNYGPANDALLLAAGYINDLYMFVGNEAVADALNPTIGIGTASGSLSDVATSLFAFKGQVATLLEEELGLMRGRDDFLPPGVQANPVYNRLFWNYTRGIDSGEVVYAINYNIQEDQDGEVDGVVDAEDAAHLYPQGHGDAYGHFLTALKGYYSLLMHPYFTWVPRTEAVLVLNQTVQVDYTDERKFAAAGLALAEAGKKVVDLTWRQDYEAGDDVGWEHLGADATRSNESSGLTRYWGVDHWASRVGQGSLINWVVGNAMLPAVDTDPDHEGIQVIDRTTVPELEGLTDVGRDLQESMNGAEGRLNPLGLTEGSMVFDIRPATGASGFAGGGTTHFDQIYARATGALKNAVTAFDDAKGVTHLLRSEENSLTKLRASVASQELAYKSKLIEIYGTPYPDDIGPGGAYETGYDGPDLTHYTYVDTEELSLEGWLEPNGETVTFRIDSQLSPFSDSYTEGSKSFTDFINDDLDDFDTIGSEPLPFEDSDFKFPDIVRGTGDSDRGVSGDQRTSDQYVTYKLGPHGFYDKPSTWEGQRESPGQIQSTISNLILAVNDLRNALTKHNTTKYTLDRRIELFEQKARTHEELRNIEFASLLAHNLYEGVKMAREIWVEGHKKALKVTDNFGNLAAAGVPDNQVFGLASGGDIFAAIQAYKEGIKVTAVNVLESAAFQEKVIFQLADYAFKLNDRWRPFSEVAPRQWKQTQREDLFALDKAFRDVQLSVFDINSKIQKLTAAQEKYRALLAKGNRIQSERELFRKRSAALVQGFRTRDASFRIFRDEKLERYNTLFDLAARYAYLAAQAFDYETGLLHTDEGRSFVNRIVESRALGVFQGGVPQFGGSSTGDPGLSSVLAELRAEWDVLKFRLGFNNPDTSGTTVSLRKENYRIDPSSDGYYEWRDVLEQSRMSNILDDEDVVRHCLQVSSGDGVPVPGLVIEFGTSITKGLNLLGQPLAGGDHAFSPSSFATKIFSLGVVLEGYPGMDDPDANDTVSSGLGVSDVFAAFLDPATLSATPYVYLIPVGEDVMRSPPLGDESVIRTWTVEDRTIPLPFNVGASDFSSKKLYQSDDSLSEPLFGLRKHQAFRPTSTTSVFDSDPGLSKSVFTNNRLIGRSVWNTGWKLVIPGETLLEDPEQGLDVLIDHLTDIKIHFETYSYSGN